MVLRYFLAPVSFHVIYVHVLARKNIDDRRSFLPLTHATDSTCRGCRENTSVHTIAMELEKNVLKIRKTNAAERRCSKRFVTWYKRGLSPTRDHSIWCVRSVKGMYSSGSYVVNASEILESDRP
jgi:hypothetical protein